MTLISMTAYLISTFTVKQFSPKKDLGKEPVGGPYPFLKRLALKKDPETPARPTGP